MLKLLSICIYFSPVLIWCLNCEVFDINLIGLVFCRLLVNQLLSARPLPAPPCKNHLHLQVCLCFPLSDRCVRLGISTGLKWVYTGTFLLMVDLPLLSRLVAAETKETKEVKAADEAVPPKPKRPAKVPAKPLPELMEEDVIPSLRAILEAQDDISGLELSFGDNRVSTMFHSFQLPSTVVVN